MRISKCFVIDACIARSSGFKTKPISEYCRLFLEEILNSSARVAFNKELKIEWDKHQSGFARKWRVAMFSRRRIDIINDSCENEHLRDVIHNAELNNKALTAALKDIHLVELALKYDKIIFSSDNTVRLIFWRSMRDVKVMEDIVWYNPVDQFEDILLWLGEGARVTNKQRLMETDLTAYIQSAAHRSYL
jgi:hypothetical protein